MVQKQTLKKNTKQKSKNKDNDSDVQSKTDCDEDGDLKTIIGKAPAKNKNILWIFCDGSAKSSAYDEKWIHCTELLLWAHAERSDAESDMSLWMLQVNISFEYFVRFLYHFWCILKNWKKWLIEFQNERKTYIM